MTLWRIAYISAAVSRDFSRDAEEILRVARPMNAGMGVTGLLVFSKGSIFQVLEGPQTAVESIYGRIERDTRHRSVIRLLSEQVEKRDFAEWSMAWLDLPPDHRLAPHVEDSLSSMRTGAQGVSPELQVLLGTFSEIVRSDQRL